MGAGIGLGAFLTGAGQGYDDQSKIQIAQNRDKREAEAFELDKKLKVAQVDEVERKRAMQDQIKRDMQALTSTAAGGTTGGTGVDEFGTEIPGLKYNNPAEAKASGLNFKQGTTVEAPAMSDFAKNRATFEIFKKARIDNGFMDEESWGRSMEMTKKLKKEGIDDAFQTFLTTGNSDAALKIFNESGGMKAPKGSFLKREVDPQTGMVDVGIYVPGKNGVPEQYTTMNQYLLMTNTDALVKHYTEMNKSKFEQGQANNRTGMEVRGKIDAALIGAGGAGGKKDRVKERIDNIVLGMGKAVAANPNNSYKSDEYVAGLEKVAALAYELMRTGKYDDEGAAVAAARQQLTGKK